MPGSSRTFLDKVWDAHVVASLGDGYDLVHIDRHLLHDLSAPGVLRAMQERGLPVHSPELTFATADHCISSAPGRTVDTTELSARRVPVLRERCAAEQIRYFDIDSPHQGIVHVIGPELGLTLPGTTIVCGDSHTCTHGAFGALAWGIGSSEVKHVLATQCMIERKPRSLRVVLSGTAQAHVTAKDMMLHLISRYGADAGSGYATEFAGPAVAAMGMEERMTVCNLAIELGSKIGYVAPDDVTFEYVAKRPAAPGGVEFDQAQRHWRTLTSDVDAAFDKEMRLDVGEVQPQITWGTSPEHAIGIGEAIPHPDDAPDAATAARWRDALRYMDLEPGTPIRGTRIDRVFIGSCTNSRLSDLRAAAKVARSGKVADGVTAWVVPGSQSVKRAAEAEGLDEIFLHAGFRWREPGCSQCVATNGEYVPAGERCVSTSNRNFVGRQGPGARTHLASPAAAALAALTGTIDDIREFG
jgi:3-isopropylmalate/(R)-2-methylmalate dehydratase large subunit